MSNTRKAVIATVGTIAAVITICSFALGIASLPQLLNSLNAPSAPTLSIPYTNSLTAPSPGWTNDEICSFQPDGYHITNGGCYAPVGSRDDVEVSIEGKTLSDGQSDLTWGVNVRGTHGNPHDTDYQYVLGSNGALSFDVCSTNDQPCKELWNQSDDTPVHTGYGVVNLLDIRAKDGHFSLYCNGTNVADVDDSTFSQGLVSIGTGDNAEVVFTNISIAPL